MLVSVGFALVEVLLVFRQLLSFEVVLSRHHLSFHRVVLHLLL